MAGDIAGIIPERLQQSKDLLETSLNLGREYGDKKLVTYSLQSISAIYTFIDPYWEQALHYSEQWHVAASELGDMYHICWAIIGIGTSKFHLGDRQGGMQDMEQGIAMLRQDDKRNNIFGLVTYAEYNQLEGDPLKAIQLFSECVELSKRMPVPYWKTIAWYRWGQAELQLGNTVRAQNLFDELLEISQELKFDQGLYNYLAGIAGVAAMLGQDERSATLFGLFYPDFSMTDVSHKVFDPLIALVRDRLGESEFNRIAAQGSKLTLEQALELAEQSDPLDEIGLSERK
jgi:tetratricopeptide (TPR) repeat protein